MISIASLGPRSGRNVELLLLVGAVGLVMLAYVNVEVGANGSVPPNLLTQGAVLLGIAVAFHLVAWQSMSTGPFLSLWSLLVAFLPVERVPAQLARGLATGSIARRVAVGSLAVALPAGYLAIYLPALPLALRIVVVTAAIAAGIALGRAVGKRGTRRP